MPLYAIILASLLGSVWLIDPPALLGQSLTPDTTAPADTQRTQADSAWVSGVYHAADTTQLDTASAEDTTRAGSDTLSGGAADTMPTSTDTNTVGAGSGRDTANSVGRDTSTVGAADTARARRTDTASASAAPADSILSAACDGAGETSSVAPDLLVVVFAPEASPGERAAVAEAVDGKLLGPVIGQPGAYYIGLPPGSEEPGLRAAADQLIRLTQVRQVGSRSCPSVRGT